MQPVRVRGAEGHVLRLKIFERVKNLCFCPKFLFKVVNNKRLTSSFPLVFSRGGLKDGKRVREPILPCDVSQGQEPGGFLC